MAKKVSKEWASKMAKKTTKPITDMAYDATVRKAIQTGTMECPECGPVEEGRENGCHLCGPTEKFVVSDFAKRNFDATKHAPAIPQTLEEFEKWLNAERPLFVRDGYAPFCKLRFYYNNTKAKAGVISLEGENAGFQPFIQTRYEARRETELPVLVRSLPSEVVNIRAKYLCVIVYDKEQMAKEGDPIDADFAVVNILRLMDAVEPPMPPITMMRNALGVEEGGSGFPLDKKKYMESVIFWSTHIAVVPTILNKYTGTPH